MAGSSMIALQRRAVTMHPLVLIVFLAFIREANSFVDPSTTNALSQLRNALNPPIPSPVLSTWGPGDPCSAGWAGIACFPPDIAALQQVVNLTLSGQGLTGILPDLNGLNGLQLLDLSNNPSLTGSVAPLALLVSLQHLNLNGTGFSSNVELLTTLNNLVTLRLGYAKFVLGLPPSFSALQQLRVLDLRNNYFSGDFPNIYGMNALEELYLSGNELAGQIPADALVLPNLRIVDLSANKLDGLLPPNLFRAAALTELRLFRNLLDGPIPPEYALFGNLTILDLHSNTLNGTLPPELPRGGALQQLYIQDNPSIVGPIPPSYENITIFVKDPTLAYETSGAQPIHPGTSSAHVSPLRTSRFLQLDPSVPQQSSIPGPSTPQSASQVPLHPSGLPPSNPPALPYPDAAASQPPANPSPPINPSGSTPSYINSPQPPANPSPSAPINPSTPPTGTQPPANPSGSPAGTPSNPEQSVNPAGPPSQPWNPSSPPPPPPGNPSGPPPTPSGNPSGPPPTPSGNPFGPPSSPPGSPLAPPSSPPVSPSTPPSPPTGNPSDSPPGAPGQEPGTPASDPWSLPISLPPVTPDPGAVPDISQPPAPSIPQPIPENPNQLTEQSAPQQGPGAAPSQPPVASVPTPNPQDPNQPPQQSTPAGNPGEQSGHSLPAAASVGTTAISGPLPTGSEQPALGNTPEAVQSSSPGQGSSLPQQSSQHQEMTSTPPQQPSQPEGQISTPPVQSFQPQGSITTPPQQPSQPQGSGSSHGSLPGHEAHALEPSQPHAGDTHGSANLPPLQSHFNPDPHPSQPLNNPTQPSQPHQGTPPQPHGSAGSPQFPAQDTPASQTPQPLPHMSPQSSQPYFPPQSSQPGPQVPPQSQGSANPAHPPQLPQPSQQEPPPQNVAQLSQHYNPPQQSQPLPQHHHHQAQGSANNAPPSQLQSNDFLQPSHPHDPLQPHVSANTPVPSQVAPTYEPSMSQPLQSNNFLPPSQPLDPLQPHVSANTPVPSQVTTPFEPSLPQPVNSTQPSEMQSQQQNPLGSANLPPPSQVTPSFPPQQNYPPQSSQQQPSTPPQQSQQQQYGPSQSSQAELPSSDFPSESQLSNPLPSPGEVASSMSPMAPAPDFQQSLPQISAQPSQLLQPSQQEPQPQNPAQLSQHILPQQSEPQAQGSGNPALPSQLQPNNFSQPSEPQDPLQMLSVNPPAPSQVTPSYQSSLPQPVNPPQSSETQDPLGSASLSPPSQGTQPSQPPPNNPPQSSQQQPYNPPQQSQQQPYVPPQSSQPPSSNIPSESQLSLPHEATNPLPSSGEVTSSVSPMPPAPDSQQPTSSISPLPPVSIAQLPNPSSENPVPSSIPPPPPPSVSESSGGVPLASIPPSENPVPSSIPPQTQPSSSVSESSGSVSLSSQPPSVSPAETSQSPQSNVVLEPSSPNTAPSFSSAAPSEPPPNTGIPSNDSSGAIGSQVSAPPVLPGEGSTSNVPSPPVTSSEAAATQVGSQASAPPVLPGEGSSPASTECQCLDGKVPVNSSSCECKFAITATIRLFKYTYENFIASEEQRREVKDLIADSLSVEGTQIQFVNISKGSVILTFYVLPPANEVALSHSEEPIIRQKIGNMTNEELGEVDTQKVTPSPRVRNGMEAIIPNPNIKPPGKSWWTGLRIALVAIGLGIIVAVLFVITAYFVLRKWNRPRPGGPGGQNLKKPSRNSGALERAGPHTPPAMTAKKYTMKELETATTSFGINSLVGEGQFGIVFQGKFDGMVKAVKKLDASLGQTEIDFYNVIGSLARLRHPNIVELQGYCVEARDRVLVYEFVDNGTLQDHLHGKKDERKPSMLLWDQRMRIATGIAKALEVLHSSRPAIVHRNFKTANVLLTKDLSPKVSDCGLLALAPHGANRQVSAQMLGTFGYSAPEYAMTGKHTVKSDVYSFGVVLLELMTGRRPLDSNRPKVEQSLVRWAVPQLGDGKSVIKMADPLMSGRYPHDVIKKFALIISDCLQPEQELRPTIADVVQLLNRISDGAGSATKFTKTPEALDQFLGDVSDDSYV